MLNPELQEKCDKMIKKFKKDREWYERIIPTERNLPERGILFTIGLAIMAIPVMYSGPPTTLTPDVLLGVSMASVMGGAIAVGKFAKKRVNFLSTYIEYLECHREGAGLEEAIRKIEGYEKKDTLHDKLYYYSQHFMMDIKFVSKDIEEVHGNGGLFNIRGRFCVPAHIAPEDFRSPHVEGKNQHGEAEEQKNSKEKQIEGEESPSPNIESPRGNSRPKGHLKSS